MAAAAQAIGSVIGAGVGLWGASKDREMQEKFAKHGISWKVADAERAGVHPLFALGANTHSYAPVGVGNADTSLASAGQDVGRAITAASTEGQRLGAYSQAVQKLTLDKMGLENQLLASQIAKNNQPGTPPARQALDQPYFIPGQQDVPGIVKTSQFSRQASDLKNPWQEPAATSDVGFAHTAGGKFAVVPSKDLKEKIEDNFIAEMQWMVRNQLLPSLGFNKSAPYPAPDGYVWSMNAVTGEYQLEKDLLDWRTWKFWR